MTTVGSKWQFGSTVEIGDVIPNYPAVLVGGTITVSEMTGSFQIEVHPDRYRFYSCSGILRRIAEYKDFSHRVSDRSPLYTHIYLTWWTLM